MLSYDRLVGYGGVKEIGGNKFFVESNGIVVGLDFGKSMSPVLPERLSHGAYDFIELGEIPRVPYLIDDSFAQYVGLPTNKTSRVNVMIFSHAHEDHIGLCGLLHRSTTVVSSQETRILAEIREDTEPKDYFLNNVTRIRPFPKRPQKKYLGFYHDKASKKTIRIVGVEWDEDRKRHGKLEEGEPRPWITRDSLNFDGLEIKLFSVDHTVPSNGVAIHTKNGLDIVYTGDVREGPQTEKFFESNHRPYLLLIEATKAVDYNTEKLSEESQTQKMTEIFSDKNYEWRFGLLSKIDVPAFFALQSAAASNGLIPLIPRELAYLFLRFKDIYPKIKPQEIGVWRREMDSMQTLDEEFSDGWKKKVLENFPVYTDEEVIKLHKQFVLIFTMKASDLGKILDWRPSNGVFIDTTSEHWSEAGKFQEYAKFPTTGLKKILAKYNVDYRKLRASGHMTLDYAVEMAAWMEPVNLGIIHVSSEDVDTEFGKLPAYEFAKKMFERRLGGKTNVFVPDYGVTYSLSSGYQPSLADPIFSTEIQSQPMSISQEYFANVNRTQRPQTSASNKTRRRMAKGSKKLDYWF